MTEIIGVSGFRKLNDKMIESVILAQRDDRPFVDKRLLSKTVKNVCPALKIKGTTRAILDMLLGYVRAEDLEVGRRPIVSLSNRRIAKHLNCEVRTVQRHIRCLVQAGIVAYWDSPSGKRYFRQTTSGKKEAYGLDFSPACFNLEKFMELTAAYWAHADAEEGFKRDVMRLAKAIRSVSEDASEAISCIRNNKDLSYQAKAEKLQSLYREICEQMVTKMEKDNCDSVEDNTVDERESRGNLSPVNDKNVTHKDSTIQSTNPLCSKLAVEASVKQTLEKRISVDLLSRACRRWQEVSDTDLRSWRCVAETSVVVQRFLDVSDKAIEFAMKSIGAVGTAVCLLIIAEKTIRDNRSVSDPFEYFLAMVARGGEGRLDLRRSLLGLASSW